MKIVILSFLIFLNSARASEVCSRVAVINYQDVMVDTSSNKKGEGLRFYLEKDEVAEELLDEYQEKTRPSLWTASFSTLGSVMILGGFALTSNNNNDSFMSKNSLLLGGALLVGISYLASKTMQYKNEELLQRAVDQYNKRNSPRIYFSPQISQGEAGAQLGIQQDF